MLTQSIYSERRFVGKTNFSGQLKKIVHSYKKIDYNMNIPRQTACMVFNPITIDSFAFLINCTMVSRSLYGGSLHNRFQNVDVWLSKSVVGKIIDMFMIFLMFHLWGREPYTEWTHICNFVLHQNSDGGCDGASRWLFLLTIPRRFILLQFSFVCMSFITAVPLCHVIVSSFGASERLCYVIVIFSG